MGLLQSLSQVMSGTVANLNAQASVNDLSSAKVVETLVGLGGQLEQMSPLASNDPTKGLHSFQGTQSGRAVVFQQDLQSLLHAGEVSVLA